METNIFPEDRPYSIYNNENAELLKYILTFILIILFFPAGLFCLWWWRLISRLGRVMVTGVVLLAAMSGLEDAPKETEPTKQTEVTASSRSRRQDASAKPSDAMVASSTTKAGTTAKTEMPKSEKKRPPRVGTLRWRIVRAATKALWAPRNADVAEEELFAQVGQRFGMTGEAVGELYVEHHELAEGFIKAKKGIDW